MVKITEELLRKKAEHNEGMLTTLEEIALHQLDIEDLNNLDKYCRHLKILLLQNNQIDKIAHINKLKELTYLNLALNNIERIEGLEGCESLKKLDLTCNFINEQELLSSSLHLKKCRSLEELYLIGNPCTDFPEFRTIIIAPNDNLISLDGKEILNSERILAKQNFEEHLKKLEEFIEQRKVNEENMTKEERSKIYSKEKRKKLQLEKQTPVEEPVKESTATQTSIYNYAGELRQCNEGRYEFKLKEYEKADTSTFTIYLPKFLDTSLIDVQLFPFHVSVRVKGKLTQIRLWEEIKLEPVSIQRSKTSGELVITLKKLKENYLLIKPNPKIDNRCKAATVKLPKEELSDDIPDLE